MRRILTALTALLVALLLLGLTACTGATVEPGDGPAEDVPSVVDGDGAPSDYEEEPPFHGLVDGELFANAVRALGISAYQVWGVPALIPNGVRSCN
jgi:hypothetical protein